MKKDQVFIEQRAAKLNFLIKNRLAKEIGRFNSAAALAEKLNVNKETFKSFRSETQYKDGFWESSNEAIGALFEFETNHKTWKYGSLEEFKTFWHEHASRVLEKRRTQDSSATQSQSLSGGADNKALIIQALKKLRWQEVSGADLCDGEVTLARHSAILRLSRAKPNLPLVMTATDVEIKSRLGALAKIRFSIAEQSDVCMPIGLSVDVVLGDYEDTDIHIRKCRIVATLDDTAKAVRMEIRRRFPDKPRLKIKPDGLAQKYGMRIAPDDPSPRNPSWALALASGPINGFALVRLLPLNSDSVEIAVSIELRLSMRQLASRKRKR